MQILKNSTPVFTDFEGQKKGALGIYAKFPPIQQNQGFQRVEKTSDFEKSLLVAERFALQSVVRKLLPYSRTAKCLRVQYSKVLPVEVWRSIEHKTANYKNLQTCGSVWSCPVCSAKISERRRIELVNGVCFHQSLGGGVYLLTFTHPHTNKDFLADSVFKESKAMDRFFSQRKTRKILESIGCIGTVRAWEVTHGFKNGWHPHFHILIFCDSISPKFLPILEALFYDAWATACRLANLSIPSREHGVKLEDGSKAAAYASKWGLENEMTKGHIKKAKASNGEIRRTPFDFLRSYLHDDDKQAGELFKEFAVAFHGKRQLVWSKGLKAKLLIDEKSDSEIAKSVEDSAYLLGSIPYEQWRLILRYDPRFNARAHVLNIASSGDWSQVQDFISFLSSLDSS